MKTATVADLRNHFRRLSAWIENGEPVQIVKRGKVFARLVPASAESKPKLAKVDWAAQRRAIWASRVFSTAEVKAMEEAELEGEQG